MFHGAIKEARTEIAKHENVTCPQKIEDLCKGIDEVSEFLTTQVVQQELQDNGSYKMKIEARHTTKDEDPPWKKDGDGGGC